MQGARSRRRRRSCGGRAHSMSKALLIESPVENPVARLRRIGARLESGIDQSPTRAFLWLTMLYLVAVFTLSSLKLLWLDELITLHIARLSNISAIWQALVQGADPNPPITHILVHLCRRLFGEHEFALRIPAAVGYWIGLLSLSSPPPSAHMGSWRHGSVHDDGGIRL